MSFCILFYLLQQQWQMIFSKPLDDKQANYLIDQSISNINDFFKKFKKENFESQEEMDKYELIKLLQCLGLSEDNLIFLFQTIVEYGIISVGHLKLANDQDYEQFGLERDQYKLIQQELIKYGQSNSKFDQVLNFLVFDQSKILQVKSKLQELGINSEESLFQLTINQIEGIGINKFKFKTQQDQINKNMNLQANQQQSFLTYSQSTQNSQLINQPYKDQTKAKIFSQEIPQNVKQEAKVPEIQKLIKKSQQIGTKNGFNLYQYPSFHREQLKDVETYKSMIVIGQTGSGKTTLLNFFLNYYLDVKFTDNFRFILINEQSGGSQAVSQTQLVTIYYIKPFNGKQGIRLIDTPGFGDTRGIAQDEIVGNQIKKCFKEDVESLSAICFLVQSSNARLTPNQNYILSCILQMFGKDIIKNFVFMLTFCDAGEPQALDALKFTGDNKHPGCPVAKMIDQIKEPWFLKLNSSALMSPNSDQMITKFFWEIAITSFQDFYTKKLLRNSPQSLILTKEVIREREELIVIIQNLRPKIDELLHLIENIKSIHQQIQCLDNKIVDSSNFKIKSLTFKIEKEQLKQGQYTTNCVVCNTTCHFPCEIPEDKDKSQCAAMKNNYCQQCNNKCIWSQHKNMGFRFVTSQEEVETELVELKKQFLDSKSNKSQKEQILDGIEEKYVQKQVQCMEMQSRLMKSVNRLKEIAIQPACCQHQEEYVEIMIQEEMQNKKDGFLQRISELQELKSNWKFIREASNNQGGIQITKQFIEKSIPKEKIKKGLYAKVQQQFRQWLS
ncbi:hypothetical protein pb186bvf_000389 [Paramecium bursaria]